MTVGGVVLPEAAKERPLMGETPAPPTLALPLTLFPYPSKNLLP